MQRVCCFLANDDSLVLDEKFHVVPRTGETIFIAGKRYGVIAVEHRFSVSSNKGVTIKEHVIYLSVKRLN